MSISSNLRAATRALFFTSLFLGFVPVTAARSIAGHDGPTEAEHTQPWRVASFLEDANLEGRGIFQIDFETDGTAWIAASDGLYRYDGYRWERFTSADGLPSDYVRSVEVTRDGTLWVGTDRGAGIFDGKTFDTRGSEDHLPGPSVRRIVEDPDGTVWFCCDQWPPSRIRSGLARYRAGSWDTWGSADGLPSDYVSDVFRDSRGEQFVLTRRGLAAFEGDRLRRPIEEAGLLECRDYIWSMVEGLEGQLLVTTADSICVRSNGRWQSFPKRLEQGRGGDLTVTRDGAVIGCTNERNGRILEWRDDRFVPIWTMPLDTQGKIEFIGEAPDGAIWIAGVNLLARWERLGGEWSSFDDLPRPRLRDAEEGIWFANPGRVLRLKDDRWTAFPGASSPLVEDRSGGVWMRSANNMVHWSPLGLERFTESEIGVLSPQVSGVDDAGRLWVAGEGPDGSPHVASFDGATWASHGLNAVGPTERIIHATPDGVRGMWYVLDDSETDLFRLLRVGGANVVDVQLPEAARRYWIPHVRSDRSGRLWLFGVAGLYVTELEAGEGAWDEITELPGRQVLNLALRGNEVWFSYMGSTGGSGGVSRLLDGGWQHLSSAARDLTSRDGDDLLFFSHPRGVYVVTGDSSATPRLLSLPEPGQVTSMVAGERADFWLGSHGRVSHYRPDGVPPETVIVGGDKNIVYGEELVLQVRGVERFKPLARSRNFDVAIRIDDGPWGEFEPLTAGTVSVAGLATGDHAVQVRVRDQGLDIDTLPAVWRFRLHPIPLQDRRWFQPLAAGVFLTVVLLAAFSIVARRREVKQRRRKLEAEHEILQISEREQRRIGRDLHDSLGQRLTGISFQCEALRGTLAKGGASTSHSAGEIGAAVREAISETRRLAYALYPPEIDRGDLEIALGSLVAATGRGFDGPCTYHHRWSPANLNRESALHVYRLVQEALGNAVRHAAATALDVESRQDDGYWIVEVRDNGHGFDTPNPGRRGLGLQIMRYRADLIGGRLRVESQPGAGTTIRCAVRMADVAGPNESSK